MNSSGSLSYLKTFSHIYIEEQAAAYSAAVRIQNRYPDAVRVPIRHYKDMFNRPRQDYSLQKQSPKLILAVKKGRLVYPGAPVCQDFGSRHFYYTSSIMNCLYDCEYCYLQGMYPSANLVIFVNLDDIFREVEQLLEQHPVYLSVSYDTDLLALEQLTGYLDRWCRFTPAHAGVTIEVRTKAANVRAIRQLPPCERVIFAWTLSPETVIRRFEHHTPSLAARLEAARTAGEAGFSLRLCFDPLIRTEDFSRTAEPFLRQVFTEIPPDMVRDASIGVFRVSDSYLKAMRRNRPDSVITQYPYENDGGVCHYGRDRSAGMAELYRRLLSPYLAESQIFLWEENHKESGEARHEGNE